MKPIVVFVLVMALFPVLDAPQVTAAPPASLQIVAHPDDDILFMNPDLSRSIRSGARVTTVFLTAGESDVLPAAKYAAERQAGAHAAFAAMAGLADDWERSVLELPGGRFAELHRLRGSPRVSLVFLGLPDDNDPHLPGGKHALTRLWNDPSTRLNTIPAAGSAVPVSTHDRWSVLAALRWLRGTNAADLVRTQDPLPDPHYQSQWGRFHDHPDHVVTAWLVGRAMPGARLIHYRDYNIADSPPDLPPPVVDEKRAVFAKYAEHDPLVSLDEPYASWLTRMRRRFTP